MKLKEKAFWKSAWNLRANKESGNGCEIDGLFSRLFLIIDVIAPSPFCPIGDLKSVREKKTIELFLECLPAYLQDLR